MTTADGSALLRVVALLAWAGSVVLSVSASALSAANGRPAEIFLTIGIYGLANGTAGTIVLLRRPGNRIGGLLVALAVVTTGLVVLRYLWPVILPLNIAFAFQANALVLAYIVLAFPSGRLAGRAEQRLFTAAVLVGVGGGMVELVTVEPLLVPAQFCRPCLANPVRLLDPALYPVWQAMNATAFLILGPALGAVVVRRWWKSRGPTRAALTPIVMGGVVIVLANVLFFVLQLAGIDVPLSGQTLLLLQLLIPIGLAAVLLRFYAARSTVSRSLLRLGRMTSVDALQAALRSGLGDRDMEVYRWSPAEASYVDNEDRTIDIPQRSRERSMLVVTRGEERIAAVIHDPALESDRELLTIVAEAVRHSLDVADLRDELAARGGDVSRLPRGDVTFLFGDVERSTDLLERLGEGYAGLLAALRGVIRHVAIDHDGHIVDLRADECFLAFGSPGNALIAAIDLQSRLAETRWPRGAAVRMRVGLHSGRPKLTDGGYVGLDVHRAARVMAAGMGGQIIASDAFASAVRDRLPDGTRLVEIGAFALRGISQAETLHELTWERH